MKRVQFIGQSPDDADDYVGLARELIVEEDTWLIRVHDGITPGGWATLTEIVARSLFVTQEDFEARINEVETNLNTINDAAKAEILASILIVRAPVIAIIDAEPVSHAIGDRYLIAHAGTTGALVGKEDQVMEYTGTSEIRFSGPAAVGHEVFNEDDSTKYYFNGTTWVVDNPDETWNDLTDLVDLKAPITDPNFLGVPTAPTAAPGTDTTQIATTEFVNAAIGTPAGAATISEMQAGINTNHYVAPATLIYSELSLKGWAIFHWSGAAVVITHKSDTINTITHSGTGSFAVHMQGGLDFVIGWAMANGSGASPAVAGSIGMGASFSGVDPTVTVQFGDAGGSGGQASDPGVEAFVAIYGITQNEDP